MVMVAHPDDCVIFAYSFMHYYKHLDWTVCYLTHTADDARGKEFANFWNTRGISTKFLGFNDEWNFVKEGQLGFDPADATQSIKEAIQDQDLILTHDRNGDYGHVHHKFIHQVVCNNHTHIVFFAGNGQGNVKYSIDAGVYDLSEFPLHQEVVAGFHSTIHANEYAVSERVRKIL